MIFDELWHQWLNRPYVLAKPVDSGRGTPIVLLHGIGRSSSVWRPLVQKLKRRRYRVIALDLLGFGDSPKPDWTEYDIDDHARSVIASLKRLHTKPVILVGHSMGSLVALRVARLRPDLVRHLLLYEMPLYDGLPEKRRYRARLAIYFAFYEWAMKQQPTFGEAKKRFSERLATKVVGSELTPETWQPFIKSLRNSIMKQTAADDIKQLDVPAEVIYGSRDMFVIRGKVTEIFGTDTNVMAHTIKERHRITTEAADFLAKRINLAAKNKTSASK